jgi:multisubunit Na+/H+ antiporter MnhE subunit
MTAGLVRIGKAFLLAMGIAFGVDTLDWLIPADLPTWGRLVLGPIIAILALWLVMDAERRQRAGQRHWRRGP